jgi:glutathionylspermidine synthase
MRRIGTRERPGWRKSADELGFIFHTEDGDPYWDESAYYQFTLRQIEDDLEDVTEEIEGLCLELVERATADEELLRRLRIPEYAWDMVRDSWRRGEKNLYGRIDLAYDGTAPAKLYEYNADTPTSLYEAAFFQWVWLEEAMEQGIVPTGSDQFNIIHEHLIEAFATLGVEGTLHCACAQGCDEDRATVAYVEDCAHQAGLTTKFIYVEDIGIDAGEQFNDLDDEAIRFLFKLYPWEWLMDEEFGRLIPGCDTQFIEPAWKSLLSNKGILPLLWEAFPGHPNLLPTYFADDPRAGDLGGDYVRKPLFSREGANISVSVGGKETLAVAGPYGAEGHILQAHHPAPEFDGNFTVIGSWLVASQPSGIGIREDTTPVTRDLSRFLPHIIRD